jgi:hypothetical protein
MSAEPLREFLGLVAFCATVWTSDKIINKFRDVMISLADRRWKP